MCINKLTTGKASKKVIVLSRAEAEKIKGGLWVCKKCGFKDIGSWAHACTVIDLDTNR